MSPYKTRLVWILLFLASIGASHSQDAASPLGTKPLTLQGDLSALMVAGINTFLMQETERSINERRALWKRDFSSAAAYEKSIQGNRERLRKIIGATGARLPVKALENIVVSMTETDPKAKGRKAEEFMDPSIYNELEGSGFFKTMSH